MSTGKKASDRARSQARGKLVSWQEHREDLLDDALKETFPASDPPSIAMPPYRRS